MKKKVLTICLCILSLIVVGCSRKSTPVEKTETKKTRINLGVPKAPPTLPILQMIETNAMGDNVELNLDYWNSPEQLIAMTQDNKHDMFALPLTVGAKLHNKGIDIKLTNVNTWGVVYFITTDKNIKEWSDLKGKTIYVPLKSSPADIFAQYFLEKNGVTVGKDVDIKYSTPSEITQLLKAGKIEYGVSLEPQVTNALSGNKNARIAFSYDTEWKKLMGEEKNFPNAGIGATATFIKENEDVMKKFEKEYEKALNYLIENPELAGELGEKHFGLNKEVVIKSMPRLGLMYKDRKNSKESLDSFYKLLFEFDPSTIGGNVPGEEFYYSTK